MRYLLFILSVLALAGFAFSSSTQALSSTVSGEVKIKVATSADKKKQLLAEKEKVQKMINTTTAELVIVDAELQAVQAKISVARITKTSATAFLREQVALKKKQQKLSETLKQLNAKMRSINLLLKRYP